MNGGMEIADEAIKQNEEETHHASEEARRVEEVVEREKRIGICFCYALAS
jgi:ribose 5-phosphate isomerase RpiB